MGSQSVHTQCLILGTANTRKVKQDTTKEMSQSSAL